jgi:hypothetical protein
VHLNLVEDCKQKQGSQKQFKENVLIIVFFLGRITVPTYTMAEMVNEDNEESEARSEGTDAWESQWNDCGKLPSFMPEFNVALAEFIVKQAGTDETFPACLPRE